MLAAHFIGDRFFNINNTLYRGSFFMLTTHVVNITLYRGSFFLLTTRAVNITLHRGSFFFCVTVRSNPNNTLQEVEFSSTLKRQVTHYTPEPPQVTATTQNDGLVSVDI